MAASAFKQKCPSCDAMVLIGDRKQIGKKTDCPQCKYRFVVEEPQEVTEVEVIEDGPKAKAKADASGKKPAPTTAPPKSGTPAAKTAPQAQAAPAKPKPAPKKGPLDDDDEDEPRFKKKPKKEGTANAVLVIGITVAVCALGLLIVAGYFVFVAGAGTGGGPIAATGPQNNGATTAPSTEPDENGAKKVQLVEMTNLLPNDTQGVYHLHFKELQRSLIGMAAFDARGAAPAAFLPKYLEERLGLKVDEVDDLLVAQNFQQNWVFAVVRTRQPISLSALKEKLALQKGEGSPIKGQEYFLMPPSTWLENLSRIMAEVFFETKDVQVPRPRSLALRIVDTHTLVVADAQQMKAFLEAGGKPKTSPKADGDASAAGVTPDRWLTIPFSLKKVLERASAAQTPLVSVAWNMGPLRDRLRQALAPFQKASVIDDKGTKLAEDVQAVALSLQITDKVVAGLSLESRSAELIELLVSALPEGSKKAFGSDSRVEVRAEEKSGTFTLHLPLPKEGNTYLIEHVLRPNMLILRGMTEMASERPRLFELAGGVQQAGKSWKGFPRGTADRRGLNFGRPFPPDQRISWMAQLLPHLGYDDVARRLNAERSWRPEYDPETKGMIDGNSRVGAVLVPAFLDPASSPRTWWMRMPSVPDRDYAATHYVGIAGIGLDAAEYPAGDPAIAGKLGIFGYNRTTRLEEIKDGTANTIMMIQVPPTFKRPWIAGGGATVQGVAESKSIAPFVATQRDKRPGTYALMADGSVRFIPADIPDDIFKAMCTISGGESIELDKNTILVPRPPELKGQPLAGR